MAIVTRRNRRSAERPRSHFLWWAIRWAVGICGNNSPGPARASRNRRHHHLLAVTLEAIADCVARTGRASVTARNSEDWRNATALRTEASYEAATLAIAPRPPRLATARLDAHSMRGD
jgi:hypothetical protein